MREVARTCADITLSKEMPSPSEAEAPLARSATTPTTPQTPATAATTRERVVDCFLEAFAWAGVEPYPASVEVGIRDVREFIVTFGPSLVTLRNTSKAERSNA